jgi:hypothetical protein
MTIIIYRLFSPLCFNCYVGSTGKDLKERFSKHRNKSHEAPNRKLYKYIFENGGFDEWQMEVLETFECDSRLGRATREQCWIDKMKPELNSVRCLA